MSHVNAYYQEVEDKKVVVAQAKSALATAQAALEAHPDYVKPKVEKAEKPAEPKAKK